MRAVDNLLHRGQVRGGKVAQAREHRTSTSANFGGNLFKDQLASEFAVANPNATLAPICQPMQPTEAGWQPRVKPVRQLLVGRYRIVGIHLQLSRHPILPSFRASVYRCTMTTSEK